MTIDLHKCKYYQMNKNCQISKKRLECYKKIKKGTCGFFLDLIQKFCNIEIIIKI